MTRFRTAAGLCLALVALLPLGDARAADDPLVELAESAQEAIVCLDHRVSMQRGGNPYDTQSRSAGFLIEGGYVVTMARFVEGRRRLDLRLYGDRRARATVVGVDPLNQIAVLELQAQDRLREEFGGALPKLPFGTSGTLRPGQTVATLGNSFDSLALDGAPSFSLGVVTSITRAEGRYKGVAIETDAAVNPGSFGGPLITTAGAVVGVIVPSFSPARFLGQAVPGDQVRLAVEALINKQKPAYGSLGVKLRSTGGEASKTGLEVLQVKPGSAAATVGIQTGDRLRAIDSVPLYDTADVARELKLLAPGSQVVLRVSSGATTRRVIATLGRGPELSAEALAVRPEPTVARPSRPLRPATPAPQAELPKAKSPRLGIRVEAREGARLGLAITEVDPHGLAAKNGVQTGDVLMAVGRKPLRSTDDLRESLRDVRGRQLLLVVRRERRMMTVRIPLEPLSAAPTRPARPSTKGPGFLGVFLTPESDERGARVDGTKPGSAAQVAGLKAGDLIVWANGAAIPDTQAFVRFLGGKREGERIALAVIRDGRRVRVTAILDGRDGAAPAPVPAPNAEADKPWLGAALELRAGRVTVVELAPGSPAQAGGLQPGDVILHADGQALSTLDALGAILSRHTAGQSLRLHVERNGWTKTLSITLAKRP